MVTRTDSLGDSQSKTPDLGEQKNTHKTSHHSVSQTGERRWIETARAVSGFVNFTLRYEALADYVLGVLLEPSSSNLVFSGRGFAITCLESFEAQQASHRTSYNSAWVGECDGLGQRVMLEFSQPNTHKEFHIGHTRNVCLGESLRRLYAYRGSEVIAANYIGDEGTHVAKALWQIAQSGETFNPDGGVSAGAWCNEHYVQVTRALEESGRNKENSKENSRVDSEKNDHEHERNSDRGADLVESAEENPGQKGDYLADHTDKIPIKEQVAGVLNELECQQGPYYDLWRQTRQWCLEDFDQIYQWLDVDFDRVYYESELSVASQKIVDDYLEKAIFEVSEGAVGLNLRAQDLGFMMVRKSNGHGLYITKELALAEQRQREYPDLQRSLYVVGDEQNFHFQQLFAALKIMGLVPEQSLFHISYGMVVLKSGKMSSRLGNTVSFWQLVKMIERALESPLSKYQGQWDERQKQATLKQLAEGTIKFGMLSQEPHRELIFDPLAWTSFEGKTGPYLMYAYARARSILRKSSWLTSSRPDTREQQQITEITPPSPRAHSEPEGDAFLKVHYHRLKESSLPWQLSSPAERALLISLSGFHEHAVRAGLQHRPSVLCHYLFDLSRDFSRFYASCPVLDPSINSSLRQQRIALSAAFSLVLRQGLQLLAITPPEVM